MTNFSVKVLLFPVFPDTFFEGSQGSSAFPPRKSSTKIKKSLGHLRLIQEN